MRKRAAWIFGGLSMLVLAAGVAFAADKGPNAHEAKASSKAGKVDAPLPAFAPLEARLPTIDAAKGDFTVVVLPDTQRYSLFYPPILRSQTHWAVQNKARFNIRFLAQVGDLTDNDTQPEWEAVDQAFSELDGVIPYLVVPGNHDYDRVPYDMGVRENSQFNGVFSYYRFLHKPWYGGHFGMTNNNSFAYFEGGGVPFLVLGLEYGPTDEVLNWARDVVKVHRSEPRQVIVVTHAYMNNDDTRLGPGDEDSSPHKKNLAWNDGEEIWDKLVRRFDNVPIVVSGHVTGRDGAGALVSRSKGGTPVVQMLSDYQFLDHGGRGYMRLLVFRPQQQRMEVYTYSPWLDEMLPGPRQNFSVAMPIFGKQRSAP
jgi:hypothetical protein